MRAVRQRKLFAVRLAVGVCAAALAGASAMTARADGIEAKPFGMAFAMHATEPSPADQTVNEPYFFDQAGGHPFALTSTVRFATEEIGEDHKVVPTRDPKDIVIDLPPACSRTRR